MKGNLYNTTQQPPDLEQANEALQRAIALNPNHAQAISWYASNKLDNGDYAGAVKLFERALELDPLARVTQTNLAQSYAGLGNQRKALDLWLESARMNPDWPAAPETISLQLVNLGRLDEALAWGHKAAALSNDPESVRGMLGAYTALEQTARAVQVARQIPRENPLWIPREAHARRLEGDPAGGLALVEAAIAKSEVPSLPLLLIGSDLAVEQGELAESRDWRERLCPLMRGPRPVFDDYGFCDAVGYAYALRGLGNHEESANVLDAYLVYRAGRPRTGVWGINIGDVEALALSGKRDEALARLREAVDAGWRSQRQRHGWNLTDNPYLQDLRSDARFRAIVAEVDADIARMRERAEAAEASSDWQSLLALAAQGEGKGPPPRVD
jgi:tetratricopeptide (TPR) repeat protein